MSEPGTMLETARLILRPFCDADRAPFAALNADPAVRRFFPGLLSRAESDALIDRIEAARIRDGFGFGAVERKGGGLIGLAGLARVDFEMPCVPCVETGWRFTREAWGQGYAAEAARAWLAHAFGTLGLDEVVAFAVPANTASLAVMRRIGMTPDPTADFDHPHLPPASPLCRHAVWRIGAACWRSAPPPEP